MIAGFVQFAVDALTLGSLYALMALGLVIVYGILRLVNFAYGELIMVAGYSLYLLNGSPLPWLVMAAMAVLAVAVWWTYAIRTQSPFVLQEELME